MTPPTCPYDGSQADLVGGERIYPHRPDLAPLKFWLCPECGAYAGTHRDSPRHAPKGGLANAELRTARMAAHDAFDPLWLHTKRTRREAYQWLRQALEMDRQPHIGFMDLAQCQRTIEVCKLQMAAGGIDHEPG